MRRDRFTFIFKFLHFNDNEDPLFDKYDDDDDDDDTGSLHKFLLYQPDNCYTSPSLAMLFLQNHTHLCETVISNRKIFSKEIVSKLLDRDTACSTNRQTENRKWHVNIVPIRIR